MFYRLGDLVKPDYHLGGDVVLEHFASWQRPAAFLGLHRDKVVAHTDGHLPILTLARQRIEHRRGPAYLSRTQQPEQIVARPFCEAHVLFGQFQPLAFPRRLV